MVQSTLNADATATVEAETTDAPTEAPTELLPAETDLPTGEALVEPTAQPTLTPVTITEIDAPSADEPEPSDTALAIGAVAVGLLLLLDPIPGLAAPPPLGCNRCVSSDV